EAERGLVHVPGVARGDVEAVDEREQDRPAVVGDLGGGQARLVSRFAEVREDQAIAVELVQRFHLAVAARALEGCFAHGRSARDRLEGDTVGPALRAAAAPRALELLEL